MDDELGFIAHALGASSVRRGERIQVLWGGYGELHRLHLEGVSFATAIVKSARPPATLRDSSLAHARKCRSYDVETCFYRDYAARVSGARVAKLLASRVGRDAWTIVLEDLDAAGFDGRDRDPPQHELDACVTWLAAFHASFLGVAPRGLWEEGTYWHLATRPDEHAAIDHRALREAAPRIDQLLRDATFRTIVHGDAKEANFCFSRRARVAVAAVDFQYAGGGCGMRDLAYLLGGRASETALSVEARGLDVYFAALRSHLPPSIDAAAIEAEWRSLYPIAWLDFQRFLAGWGSVKTSFSRDRAAHARIHTLLKTIG